MSAADPQIKALYENTVEAITIISQGKLTSGDLDQMLTLLEVRAKLAKLRFALTFEGD